MEDSSIRGTILLGCLLSIRLLQGHLCVWPSCQLPSVHITCPGPLRLHAGSSSFICKVAGRAGSGGATLVGKGLEVGTRLGLCWVTHWDIALLPGLCLLLLMTPTVTSLWGGCEDGVITSVKAGEVLRSGDEKTFTSIVCLTFSFPFWRFG